MSDVVFDIAVLKRLAAKGGNWTVAEVAGLGKALPLVVMEMELLRQIVLEASELLDQIEDGRAMSDIDLAPLITAFDSWIDPEVEL